MKITIDLDETRQMLASGHTVRSIAERVGISVSTIRERLKEANVKVPKQPVSNETRRRRSLSLKNFHTRNPLAAARQTSAIRERSLALKGKTIDQIYDDETCQRLRSKAEERMTGRKLSLATRLKMSRQRKGRRFSEEARRNISKSRRDGILSGRIKLSSRCGCGHGGHRKDLGHYVRSTYEHYYAQQLIKQGVRYFYEPKTFPIVMNGSRATFTPDFYLPDEKKWVEIKNEFNVKDVVFVAKLQAFKSQYPDEAIEVIVGNRSWVPTPS